MKKLLSKITLSTVTALVLSFNCMASVDATVSKKTILNTEKNNSIFSGINPVDTNIYYIKPACARSSAIDISGGSLSYGANCQLWGLNYTYAQQFNLVYQGSDSYGKYYTIAKANNSDLGMNFNNLVLDVSGGIVRNGQNIQLYGWNGTKSQQWYLKSAGNSEYYLVSRLNTNYVMDISGGGSQSGTNVHLYRLNYTAAQKFSFNTCDHSHKSWYSGLTNDSTDMYSTVGWKCLDCGHKLTRYDYQLPN